MPDVEAAAGPYAGTRRGAVAQRHHSLVVSSRGCATSHVADAAADGEHSPPRMPHEGRVVMVSQGPHAETIFLPRERGGEGRKGHGGGR